MGMRKLERSVARYRLQCLGYTGLNDKRSDKDGKPVPSGFSQIWRKIMTIGTPLFKEWDKYWKNVQRQNYLEKLKGEA